MYYCPNCKILHYSSNICPKDDIDDSYPFSFRTTYKQCTCFWGRDSNNLLDRSVRYNMILGPDPKCPVHGR